MHMQIWMLWVYARQSKIGCDLWIFLRSGKPPFCLSPQQWAPDSSGSKGLAKVLCLVCRNCILIYQGRKESWRAPQALCAVIEINLLQSKYSLYICKRATERKQSGERQGPWKVRLDGSCLASIESIDRVASIWLPKRYASQEPQDPSLGIICGLCYTVSIGRPLCHWLIQPNFIHLGLEA